MSFKTQERNASISDFEKDSHELLNNAFYGKTMDIVRNELKNKFNKQDNIEELIKQ